jgi:hypothetical protein
LFTVALYGDNEVGCVALSGYGMKVWLGEVFGDFTDSCCPQAKEKVERRREQRCEKELQCIIYWNHKTMI